MSGAALSLGRRRGPGSGPAPLAVPDGSPQQVLDLSVDAAQLVRRPLLEVGPQVGVEAEQELLAVGHPLTTSALATACRAASVAPVLTCTANPC